MILLALVALWFGLWIVGVLSTIIYLAFILAILYLVGLLIWKFFTLNKNLETTKTTYQLNTDLKDNEGRLSDATHKLEEIKRQTKQN
ncbi:MAG: hypothetical protein FD167_4803 [bacterium]|nr:MAG: hypothetical protein FD167_4803 [bacterium]